MSLVSLTNGDTITVSTAFQNLAFEAWLFDQLLVEALGIRGDDVVATRPERHFPALLVDGDLRRLELFALVSRDDTIVYTTDIDDTEYTLAVVHYDGKEYSIAEKILVIKGDGGGDNPDLSELTSIRLSEQLILFGL